MNTQKQILAEGLKYLDMENQVIPLIGVDEFRSSIGEDDDMITIHFLVKGKRVADDLAEWFERGYDWVIDAEPSPGEVTDGRWIVFVEMNRRSNTPKQIMEMIDDLETLTGIKSEGWQMKIGDKKEAASVEFMKKNLTLSPHEYRATQEEPLNEWREIAGIETVSTYNNDEEMKAMKRRAGIY